MGRCARLVRDDERGKSGRMREARQCGCARQGKVDSRGKAGLMREVRQFRCA
jgi:hypothetical protein